MLRMYDIHSVVFVLSPFLNVKQAKQPAACGNESTENKKQKSFTKTITIQFQHFDTFIVRVGQFLMIMII